jgi:hypothetical protein
MANSAPSSTTAVGQERAVDSEATASQAFVAGSYRATPLSRSEEVPMCDFLLI